MISVGGRTAAATSAPKRLSTALADLGWGPSFQAAFEDQGLEGAVPGRVARVDRGALTVLTEAGELRAVVAAEMAHEPDPLRAPTVGDWVVLHAGSDRKSVV